MDADHQPDTIRGRGRGAASDGMSNPKGRLLDACVKNPARWRGASLFSFHHNPEASASPPLLHPETAFRRRFGLRLTRGDEPHAVHGSTMAVENAVPCSSSCCRLLTRLVSPPVHGYTQQACPGGARLTDKGRRR